MYSRTITKLVCLNACIAVFIIIIFSPGLINIRIDGPNTLETAIGITLILMSVVVFAFGNYTILIMEEKIIKTDEIKNILDCIDVLKQNYFKKTFSKDILTILNQIERFNKKKETINNILLQKFSSSELSYSKFKKVVTDIENLIFVNIKSILNKLNVFDEEDYKSTVEENNELNISEEVIRTKRSIYAEYISFIKDSIEDNEEILIKMDKFLLEISKFDSLEDGEIENMDEMKDIDDIIEKVKFYK